MDGKGIIENVLILRSPSRRAWLRNPSNLVLFHIDGDIPWSQGEGGTRGPNLEAFERKLKPAMEAVLAMRQQSDCLERFMLVVPYYSIEAWIFQNLEEAKALYMRHYPHGHEAVRLLEHYEGNRSDLEEACDLKERFRLLSQHRLHLVLTRWPSRKALNTRRSFALAVERLRACLERILAGDAH